MGGPKGFVAVCRIFAVMSLLVALGSITAFAQTSQSILGTVKDTSGGVVAGASVTVRNTETQLTRTLPTGDDGAYRFSGLPTGHYDVTAERDGFKKSTRKDLVLDVSQELVTNFALEVGSPNQSVEVTAEAPVVNTTSGSLGGLVNEEKLAELPLNGRDYLDLTLLQPGVAQTSSVVNLGGGTQGVIFSSNGAPIRSNNYLIDGAPMQNIFGFNAASASGSTLGLDGIREYKVLTSAFPAEYGMTMGSQMTIVSKGGSNQFHGDAFEYLRNRVMDARNFFDNSQLLCEQIDSSANCPRSPVYQRNNFGGAFGGPIKKDKTFFWGVYEGLRQVKGNPVLTKGLPDANGIPGQCVAEAMATNPGSFTISGNGPKTYNVLGNHEIDSSCDANITNSRPIGSFGGPFTVNATMLPYVELYDPADSNYTQVSPTHVDYGQMRVDQNFGNNDSMFVRYTIDNASETVPGPGFGATPYGFKEFNDSWTSRDQYITVSENHIFSPTLLNSARLSFSRTNVPTNYINGTSATGVSTAGANVSFVGGGQPMGLIVIGAAGTGGSSADTTMGPDFASPNYHLQNYWSLGDDLFYTRGKHGLKFGFLGNRVQIIDGEPVFGRGVVDYLGCGAAGGDATACFMDGSAPTLVMTAIPGGIGRRHYRYETYGFYGQDDWRATSRLTLNLGLRYEFNTTMTESQGLQTTLLTPQSAALTPGPFMKNPSLKNFSPRAGFAYDPFGKGKTSIRGAFGIYYDISTIGDTTFGETVGDVPYRQTDGFAPPPGNFQMGPNWINSYPGHFTPLNPCVGASNATLCPGAFPAPGATNTFTGYEPTAGIGVLAYNVQQPYMMQWNLSIDQQLPGAIGLSVSYVGTRGIHLWSDTDENPCQPTGTLNGEPDWINAANVGCPAGADNATYHNNANNQPCPFYVFAGSNPISIPDPQSDGRFNCSMASLIEIGTGSRSWYDGLQVTLNKRLSHGLEFQSSYTWSKELDTTSGQIFIDYELRTPATSPNFDKGPGVTNAAQNWRFNTLYHFGTWKSDRLAAKFVNGWWMGNIISVQSGYNFTPSDGIDSTSVTVGGVTYHYGEQNTIANNNGGYERPATVTSANLAAAQALNPNAVVYNPSTVITKNPNGWFNTNMFTLPAAGTLGNVSRGFLTGPGLIDWDLSFNKDTKVGFLGEAGNLQFRAEIFNVANHPNLVPNTASGNGIYGTNGRIGGPEAGALFVARDGRDIQLALKVNF
jgi:hypothetical protein